MEAFKEILEEEMPNAQEPDGNAGDGGESTGSTGGSIGVTTDAPERQAAQRVQGKTETYTDSEEPAPEVKTYACGDCDPPLVHGQKYCAGCGREKSWKRL